MPVGHERPLAIPAKNSRAAASGLALNTSIDMREIKIEEGDVGVTLLLVPLLQHGQEKTRAIAVNLSWIHDYYYLRYRNRSLQE